MSYKQNINYFKISDILLYIGLGCLAVGGFIFIFGSGYLWLMSTVVFPAGAVFFIVGASIRSNDKDIDQFIKKNMEGVEVDLTENSKYARRVVKDNAPIIVSGYEYLDGLMVTKAKNGLIRTSKFTKSCIYLLRDCIYISTRTISLINDEAKSRNIEIPLSAITSAEVKKEEKTLKFGKKEFLAKSATLTVKYSNGYSFSTPMENDIRANDIADKLNRAVSDYKTSLN